MKEPMQNKPTLLDYDAFKLPKYDFGFAMLDYISWISISEIFETAANIEVAATLKAVFVFLAYELSFTVCLKRITIVATSLKILIISESRIIPEKLA